MISYVMKCPRRGYLRVSDAAALLRVAPVTVRSYCARGYLNAYRIGRGSVAHRRLPYQQVEALANALRRSLPPTEWLEGDLLDQDEVATFLGLSVRYLRDEGLLQPGQRLTFEQLKSLESTIYGRAGRESEASTMQGMQHQGMGMGRMAGAQGSCCGMGPGCGPKWMATSAIAEWENADTLTLRSWKRHLEALKADIQDRLSKLEHLLARSKSSPDDD